MVNEIVQKIYPTRHASQRLQGMGTSLISLGHTLRMGARMLKVKTSTLEDMIMLNRFPSITKYIFLARFFEWDISCDANYYYSQRRRYTGKEIFASRIARLCECRNVPLSVRNYYRTAYRNDAFTTEAWYHFLRSFSVWEKRCGFDPLELDD